MMRLEVAIAAPLEKTLSYNFQSSHQLFDEPIGRRVLVPLGGRLVTGYVIGILPERETGYVVKDIREILDNTALFHPEQVPFFRWIAGYYHYPLGQVIQTALPAGLNTRSVKTIHYRDNSVKPELPWSDEKMPVPEWYDKLCSKGNLTASMTRKILGGKKWKKTISQLLSQEHIYIHESIQQDRVKEKKETCFGLSTTLEQYIQTSERDEFSVYHKTLRENLDPSLKISEAKTLYYLSELSRKTGKESIPRKEVCRTYSGAAKALKSLIEKKYIHLKEERVYRNPFGEQFSYFPRPERLSANQDIVLKELIQALQLQTYSPYLLHGITGSGKTEVYLRCAEETLKLGRDVLILVPEIALATQLESHFISRFGDQVVLLHSGLSAGEKLDQWTLAAKGEARIVIGARSAVFAPLKDPGLIVVDEEHDQGFKQDDALRYHGRDLAILRGSMQNSLVLLGSATPSITSYYNASQGKYGFLEMDKRVGERSLPDVTMVDLTQKKERHENKLIRRLLKEELKKTFDSNKQSLLLLNRRGFSGVFLCQDCGSSIECRNCNVSLTYHKSKETLICHYCGYSQTSKTICNSCQSTNLVPVGVGTERVEEEVRLFLPDARIERLDSDTAADRKKFLRLLKAMHDGEIDVLIGTQMIAKGHHFPNVTLVGIVWADGGLNMPDFRASERVFQLISQVTGRAGRGDTPGKVIIQSMRTNHYSLTFAQKHNYKDFFKQEISIRKSPAFPPYVRLVLLRMSGSREYDVKNTATAIAKACQLYIKRKGIDIELLGPAPSPLDRLCDKFRWQLLLRGSKTDDLRSLCKHVLEKKSDLGRGKIQIAIDVDPENMM